MVSSFRRFFAVVSALIVREATTRFGRSFGGYAWAFLEPTLIIVVLGYIFNAYFGAPPLGNGFALFYCTGLVPFVIFSEIVDQIGNALIQNKPLLNFRPVTPISTIVARFILSVSTLSFVSVVVFTTVLGLTNEPYKVDWAPLLLGLAGAALLGLGTGSVNAVLFSIVPTWRNIWSIISRPLFLVSGIFFLYEPLPTEIQDILYWNPLIHVVSLVREGFYDQYDPTWISGALVFGFSIACILISRISLVLLRHRVVESL